MSNVTLHLPEVKYFQAERPSRCLYCADETFQRWGGTAKRVRDPHMVEAKLTCPSCSTCSAWSRAANSSPYMANF